MLPTYLSTYGFLALVGLTSYDLTGEVIHTGELRSKLAQRESDLRTAVADERNRIAGELHDSVAQTLFSTAAIADALPEVWRRRPAEAANDLFVDSFDSAVELTDREREVLALLVKGMSNKEIARQLHRSPFTVPPSCQAVGHGQPRRGRRTRDAARSDSLALEFAPGQRHRRHGPWTVTHLGTCGDLLSSGDNCYVKIGQLFPVRPLVHLYQPFRA